MVLLAQLDLSKQLRLPSLLLSWLAPRPSTPRPLAWSFRRNPQRRNRDFSWWRLRSPWQQGKENGLSLNCYSTGTAVDSEKNWNQVEFKGTLWPAEWNSVASNPNTDWPGPFGATLRTRTGTSAGGAFAVPGSRGNKMV